MTDLSDSAKLVYKAKAGIRDGIAEFQGVLSTQEKFEAKRWEMANHVWDEMKANNSANCRTCHLLSEKSEVSASAKKKLAPAKINTTTNATYGADAMP